ncbi:MAG: transposase [Deltaproteobacteria bacterium]|nr:transposase [Deltaproteobacteria bacterium]
MRNLMPFSIGSVIKKLNHIHFQISTKHQNPFPKPEAFCLSKYVYERRYIRIHPDGRIEGGLSRFVSSLGDFSFIRSLVAHKYSIAGIAYDPVSLFLLELFRHIEKYSDMKAFVEVLRDWERGRHYRLYAGINSENIPCEATFTNFKERLGEDLYNQIFHVLVEIAELLRFLSYRIIATDGTLFPTNARYKGCTWFEKECKCIEFVGIIENVRRRVLYRLNHPGRKALFKELRVKVECSSQRFTVNPKIKRPRVEILTLCLREADPEKPSIFNQIFGVKEELQKAGLDLVVKRGVFTEIILGDSAKTDSFFFRCPKLPHDPDARIGVRRNPRNPNHTEKIFGFNAIIDTAIELDLGIELPVSCTVIAGNGEEGRHFITNKNQILHHHGKTSKIHIADAKYDEINNYNFSRSRGAIPIIDYNPRSENLSPETLKTRGYDHKGWPYAPCGLITHPNGFDQKSQRASFSCRRQCLHSKDPQILRYAEICKYWINYHGYTRHMSVKDYPRLISEVLRGTDRYQKIKSLRSASERTNSTAKEDLCILKKPKIRGLKNAGILAQLAVMALLLKRIICFIVKVTLAVRKISSNNPSSKPYLPGPDVPRFILNLIQRE